MTVRNDVLIAVAMGLLCASCATTQPPPEITRASTLIQQAEKTGAQQYAAAQLDSARNHLKLANAAARAGKQDEARAQANEAAADAELAQARAASGAAQQAADEVQRSTDTLERESQRHEESRPAQPAKSVPTQPTF